MADTNANTKRPIRLVGGPADQQTFDVSADVSGLWLACQQGGDRRNRTTYLYYEIDHDAQRADYRGKSWYDTESCQGSAP